MNPTLVIGLGNPILSDDTVGLHIIRALREIIGSGNSMDKIDIMELYAGGIRLIDILKDRETVILVDAMLSGLLNPGEWSSCWLGTEDSFPLTRNASSTHDLDIQSVLEMGEAIGLKMPSKVRIWGVEVTDVHSFAEYPTEQIQKSVIPVAREIASFISLSAPVGSMIDREET